MIAAPILNVRSHHVSRSTLACFIVVDMRSAYDEARIGALVRLGAKSRNCHWCTRPMLVDIDNQCSYMTTDTVDGVSMDDVNLADEEGFDDGWSASSEPVTTTSHYCSPECIEWSSRDTQWEIAFAW